MCPGSSYPFYIVSYYIKWVTTSWTYGILIMCSSACCYFNVCKEFDYTDKRAKIISLDNVYIAYVIDKNTNLQILILESFHRVLYISCT